mmetsp:Transcript_14093/g.18312  ORF Transcript_14093/g.18312 Transcript_14093/m.18312 type:complete len:282 (+) Transcript_14093:92-937(+)
MARRQIFGFSVSALVFYEMSKTNFVAATSDEKEHLKGWKNRWDKGISKGWQLAQPHEMLVKNIDLLFPKENKTETSRVFVPLCGKDVSLGYLASLPQVKQVVGVEASEVAAQEFSQENPEYKVEITKKNDNNNIFTSYISKNDKLLINIGDFFDSSIESIGNFDIVWDRASLVAIDPKFRINYAKIMNDILNESNGKILLVTFDRRSGSFEAVKAGPPYSVNKQTVYELFDKNFNIQILSEMDVTDKPEHTKFKESGITSLYEITFLLEKKKKNVLSEKEL